MKKSEQKFDIIIRSGLPWKIAQAIRNDISAKLPYYIIAVVESEVD